MNKELLMKILSSGMDISHYYILHLILTNGLDETVRYHPKVKSWINAMEKKGLLIDIKGTLQLTSKGRDKYFEINALHNETAPIVAESDVKVLARDINDAVTKLVLKATGERRLMFRSKNISYAINASNVHLEESLLKFIQIYKIDDFDKIKRAILAYFQDILDGKNTSPHKLVNFIIRKNKETNENESDLLMYIETLTDVKKEAFDKHKLYE